MITVHRYKKLVRYPHMKPNDVRLWERFINKFPNYFGSVIYDFHVGEGATFLPTNNNSADGRENRLYQKKIDVLGSRDNFLTIIELKPRADIKALGQVIAYEILLPPEIKANKVINQMVITHTIDDDMRKVYNKMAVNFVLI